MRAPACAGRRGRVIKGAAAGSGRDEPGPRHRSLRRPTFAAAPHVHVGGPASSRNSIREGSGNGDDPSVAWQAFFGCDLVSVRTLPSALGLGLGFFMSA